MKRFSLLVLAASLLFATGCPAPKPATDAFDDAKARGELIVAMDAGYVPFEIRDPLGRVPVLRLLPADMLAGWVLVAATPLVEGRTILRVEILAIGLDRSAGMGVGRDGDDRAMGGFGLVDVHVRGFLGARDG